MSRQAQAASDGFRPAAYFIVRCERFGLSEAITAEEGYFTIIMRPFRTRSLLLSAIVLLLASSSLAQAQSNARTAPPDITFTVSMPKPHTHLLEVEVRVRRGAQQSAPAQETLV
ncbi:MAG: hypothetical protein ICV68_07695, partial [Pyrinomonadaceae bacterium]|nr:hypothetical protein [Pyrinomonadaceae bacterium]